MRFTLALSFTLLTACGSDSVDSVAIVSGSASGAYGATSFTVKNGVVGTTSAGATVIALSSDDFGCATLRAPSPPSGNYAAISVTELAPGTYSNVGVQMYENHGSFHSLGSNTGSLVINTVDDMTVNATIAYTETIDGTALSLAGTFEVERCP